MHILYTIPNIFHRADLGKLDKPSRASLVGDPCLYSRDLNGCFRDDAVRRNKLLVTPWG